MTIGLHIMRPSSIAVAGGGTETASIRSDGGVEFANATSLSLNGVFTADYDNYMVVWRVTSTSVGDVEMRLRSSGTDDTATNYVWQFVSASGTLIAAQRYTSFTYWRAGQAELTQTSGFVVNVYGPSLVQPTAYRTVTMTDAQSARLMDFAGTHNQSTSYDGITFWDGTHTGMVTVYGYAQ